MKLQWLALTLVLALAACEITERVESQPLASPSGRYLLVAAIDDVSKHEGSSFEDPHWHVLFELKNTDGIDLAMVDTRASPYSKWAFGWMPDSDTAVLYSSDIGPRVYVIEDDAFVEISVTEPVMERACELYEVKYGEPSGRCDRLTAEQNAAD